MSINNQKELHQFLHGHHGDKPHVKLYLYIDDLRESRRAKVEIFARKLLEPELFGGLTPKFSSRLTPGHVFASNEHIVRLAAEIDVCNDVCSRRTTMDSAMEFVETVTLKAMRQRVMDFALQAGEDHASSTSTMSNLVANYKRVFYFTLLRHIDGRP